MAPAYSEKEIIQFKVDNPDTVLLIGNHDYHYLHHDLGEYSRYNPFNAKKIKELLENNLDKMQVAYYHKDHDVLIKHAGVSKTFYNKSFGEIDDDPNIICENINYMYKEKPVAFSFYGCNTNYFECYGNEPSQSPMWIRPQSLITDMLDGIKQIVGHTQVKKISTFDNLTLADCLGTVKDCVKITY